MKAALKQWPSFVSLSSHWQCAVYYVSSSSCMSKNEQLEICIWTTSPSSPRPSSYLPTYTNPTLIVVRVASGEALKPSSIQSRWRTAEGRGLFSPRPRGRWLWARAERQTKSRPQGRALALLARKRLTNCCGERKRICKDRLEVVLNWPPRFLRITGRGAHLAPGTPLHFSCLSDWQFVVYVLYTMFVFKMHFSGFSGISLLHLRIHAFQHRDSWERHAHTLHAQEFVSFRIFFFKKEWIL